MQTQIQKTIGTALSLVVVFSVVAVTTFSGNNTPDATMTTTASPTAQTQTKTTTTQGTTTTASPVSRFQGDEEDGEDDGGGATTKPVPPPVKVSIPPADTTKKTVSMYVDGTYTATGSYDSPGGYDQLDVSVTLKNDIIVATSVSNFQGGRTSQRYMNMFASGYQTYVVGKNIANVQLSRVSGSSLTPAGFNDALAQIKSKAKA